MGRLTLRMGIAIPWTEILNSIHGEKGTELASVSLYSHLHMTGCLKLFHYDGL